MLPLVQLYPDVGVAAMLRNEWKDASFEIGAVSDKKAVGEGDDLVIIAAVDPQGVPFLIQGSASECNLKACLLDSEQGKRMNPSDNAHVAGAHYGQG